MKPCPRCNKNLPFDMFYKSKASKDGCSAYCKACSAAYAKKWQAKNLTPERRKKYQDKFKEENPGYNTEKAKEWRAKNPERFKEIRREKERKKYEKKMKALRGPDYVVTPRVVLSEEEKLARRKESWKKSYEKKKLERPQECVLQTKIKHSRRRAKKVSSGGSFTKQQVLGLLESQKFLCVVCKTDIKNKYHADHVVPLAAGGSNDILNIQLLCPSCNLSKGAKDPIQFMQTKGYLL